MFEGGGKVVVDVPVFLLNIMIVLLNQSIPG